MTRDDAITQSDEACWVLRLPNGEAADDGGWGDSHYPTEEAAAKEAANLRYKDDPASDLVPVRLDTPCWTATAVCGYQYDVDGDYSMVEHWPGRDALLDMLLHLGWKAVEGGGMTCGDDGCQTCTTLPTVAAPVEMAGQMPLADAERAGSQA